MSVLEELEIEHWNATDTIQSLKDKIAQLEKKNSQMLKLATDRRYMMEAYKNMLGENGLVVVDMWNKRNVKRVHYSWGTKGSSMTGEERAKFILDEEEIMRSSSIPPKTKGHFDVEDF